ncbi:class I SAM-dependent methyltransferase [Arenicellales bacterium nBUS_48]
MESTFLTIPAVLMPFVAKRVFGWEPIELDKSLGINDLQNGWAYSLCRTNACKNCEMLFLDIRFSAEQVRNLYKDYRGEEYVRQRKTFEPNYVQSESAPLKYIDVKEKFIKPYLPSTDKLSILDWGGDTGQSVVFNNGTNDLYSYDLGDPRQLKNGVKNFPRTSGKKFNLITCSHVLEHVTDPVDFIEDIKNFLGSSGVLFLEVPLERIMDSENGLTLEEKLIQKRHWHEHINFFSLKSLEFIFDLANFECLEMDVRIVEAPGNFEKVIMACIKPQE